MANEYFVYDNWVRSKAITHRAECSFCKNGNGLHGQRSTNSSTWHGPFAKIEEAHAKAKALKRDRTEDCSICSP